MRKKGVFILVCVCLLGVTGCGNDNLSNGGSATNNKKSTAELVYENTSETFNQFANNEITTEELTSKLTDAYNEYCNNSDDESCTLLNTAISASQRQPEELKDCSTYSDATAKNLCESTNNSIQSQNENLDITIRSQVDSISKELSRLASNDTN